MRSGAIRRFGSYFIDNILMSFFQVIWLIFSWDTYMSFIEKAYQLEDGLITIQEYMTEYWAFMKNVTLSIAVVLIPLSIIYMVVLPYYWDGKTAGRHIVGVKLQNQDESPLTFWTIFVREVIFKVLWWTLTLGIGSIVDFIMVAVREDKQSIRDIITRTEVVDIEGESVKEEYYSF